MHRVKRLFGVTAVDDVNFVVRPGEIVGLPRTERLRQGDDPPRMLTGLLDPTTATIAWNGHDIHADLVASAAISAMSPKNRAVDPSGHKK